MAIKLQGQARRRDKTKAFVEARAAERSRKTRADAEHVRRTAEALDAATEVAQANVASQVAHLAHEAAVASHTLDANQRALQALQALAARLPTKNSNSPMF